MQPYYEMAYCIIDKTKIGKGFNKSKGGRAKGIDDEEDEDDFHVMIAILMMIVMIVMRGRRREVFHQKALSPPLAANLSFCSHTSSSTLVFLLLLVLQ